MWIHRIIYYSLQRNCCEFSEDPQHLHTLKNFQGFFPAILHFHSHFACIQVLWIIIKYYRAQKKETKKYILSYTYIFLQHISSIFLSFYLASPFLTGRVEWSVCRSVFHPVGVISSVHGSSPQPLKTHFHYSFSHNTHVDDDRNNKKGNIFIHCGTVQSWQL